MDIVKFSADKNTVEVDGLRYTAVEAESGRCKGCEFIRGFGCRLVERGLLFSGSGPTFCMPVSRADKRSIIWRLSSSLVKVARSPE